MSYEDGWDALNLRMPARVPRTEYSAEGHWDLIRAVTGIDVSVESTDAVKERARSAFVGPAGWNYDFFWSTLIGRKEFGPHRTSMGHATYAAGGVDWDTDVFSPYTDPEDVLAFDPWASLGEKDPGDLARRFEAHYDANVARHPGGVNMTGVYVTCVSGMIDLFGWNMLLLAAGTDPKRFGDLVTRYGTWILQYYEALAEAAVPVVMVHDDIVWTRGPFIHPDWYRAYVFPSIKRCLAPLVEAGKRIVFTADGNYTTFVDDIADCGVHAFVMEPTTNMALVAERYGRTHALIGNVDTRVLLNGTREEIRLEVVRCMAIGKTCPGFFLAVGNHIPPNTPVESCLYYNDVYETMSRR